MPVIYVDAAAVGAGTGASWDDAFTDIQDAFALAGSGSQVWVAAATYTPAPPNGDRGATFAIPPGTTVYGGSRASRRLCRSGTQTPTS